MSVIGLDIGTTNIRAAVFQHGQVHIIADDEGNCSIPNCVAFTETERLYGTEAKEQAAINLANTVTNAMRMIGRRSDDRLFEFDQSYWPCEMDGSSICVNYMGKRESFYPVEILSMMIRKMKYLAADHFGTVITSAVITVPAGFNYEQLQAARAACAIANLNVIGITNGPTACTVACIHQKLFREANSNVLIFHLGGGTCDILIFCIQDGVVNKQFIRGDVHLGGEDITNRMVSRFIREFKRIHKIDLHDNRHSVHLLRKACEQAKRELSVSDQTTLNIDSLYGDVNFSTNITRARFEELNAGLFGRMQNLVNEALADAELDPKSIDDIVLVGGSTAIPKVRAMLQEYLDGKPLNTSVDPNEAVVYGAAIRAATLSGCKHDTIESIVFPELCIRCYAFRFGDDAITTMIHRNMTIPTKVSLGVFQNRGSSRPPLCLYVYEYEDISAPDKNKLTALSLQDLVEKSSNESNEPQIEAEFDLDSKMQLTVSVLEINSGIRKMKIIRDARFAENIVSERRSKEQTLQRREQAKRKQLHAETSLKSCLNAIKRLVADERIKAKLSDSEHEALLENVEETIRWMATNTVETNLTEFLRKEHKLRQIIDWLQKYL